MNWRSLMCESLLIRDLLTLWIYETETEIYMYRVFQKNGTQFYFGDNFPKCSPIFTIFSLLEPEIYGA